MFETVDGGNIRMAERGHDLRFTREARETVGVNQLVGQNLQRDVAAKPGVSRAIDLAHAPGANRLLNVIWTDACAGRKGHASSSGDGQILIRET
jgi:hypothetical protein